MEALLATVTQLEGRAKRKGIQIPSQRYCTGCRAPTRGHGVDPPYGPDCRKKYTDDDKFRDLNFRIDAVQGALRMHKSKHQDSTASISPISSVSSLHDVDVSIRATGNLDGDLQNISTSSRIDLNDVQAELRRIQLHRSKIEMETSQIHKEIRNQEEKLAQQEALEASKAELKKEKALVNASLTEQNSSRQQLNTLKRKVAKLPSKEGPSREPTKDLSLPRKVEHLANQVKHLLLLHSPSASQDNTKP